MFSGGIGRPIYSHLRHAYQQIANRSFAGERRELAALIRQFVKHGDLVFDVGANKGDYTDMLLTIGARVVAVEPNPNLAAFIARRYPVAVEAVALGAEAGEAELRLGRNPGHSTLSPDWVACAPGGDRWSGINVRVRVKTLDDLIVRYGEPAFVKLDVEGYEAHVLAGCHSRLPALSFEYQCAALGIAEVCLEMLDEKSEFNSVRADERQFGIWCGSSDLRERLRTHQAAEPAGYGDVYMRRR